MGASVYADESSQREANWGTIIICFIYTVLFCSIPWLKIHEYIYGYAFEDRDVYISYFKYEESVLKYADFSGILSYVTNEYAWHYGISYMLEIKGVPLEFIFGVISFGCIFIFSVVLAVNRGAYSLIFLFNPLLVDLAFSQLRSALAASLLALAYLLKSRRVSLLIVCVSPFVHTASLLLVAMYAVAVFCSNQAGKNRDTARVQFAILCFAGVLTSLSVGPFREVILSLVGDRRVEYPDMASSSLYLLYWVLLLMVAATHLKFVTSRVESAFSIIVLSFVCANIIFGGYSTRILAISLPFVFTMMLGLPGVTRFSVVSLYLVYASAQWLYWLRV